MRILFDQGTPVPLRGSLTDHEVETAFERGWNLLENGDLLKAAEMAGFEAIVTTDQNLRYQQNLPERKLAILVLMTTDWRLIRQHVGYVANAISKLGPRGYAEVPFPPA